MKACEIFIIEEFDQLLKGSVFKDAYGFCTEWLECEQQGLEVRVWWTEEDFDTGVCEFFSGLSLREKLEKALRMPVFDVIYFRDKVYIIYNVAVKV